MKKFLIWLFLWVLLIISYCTRDHKETTRYEYKPTTTTTTTTTTTNNYNTTRTTNTNSYNKSNDYSNDYRRYQYWSYDDYIDNVPEDYREDYPYQDYIEDRVYQNKESWRYTTRELANQLWVDEAEIMEYEY